MTGRAMTREEIETDLENPTPEGWRRLAQHLGPITLEGEATYAQAMGLDVSAAPAPPPTAKKIVTDLEKLIAELRADNKREAVQMRRNLQEVDIPGYTETPAGSTPSPDKA